MGLPRLVIDLEKIGANAAALRDLAHSAPLSHPSIIVVLKGCLSDGRIAEAVAAAGLTRLADSRISNLAVLRDLFPQAELTLLRQPGRQEYDDAAGVCDRVCLSTADAVNFLSRAACRQNKEVGVLLIVECGDLRDGVVPRELPDLARHVLGAKGLRLEGVLGNTGCLGGVKPTLARHEELVRAARRCERSLGIRLDCISGGNSGSIALLLEGRLPDRVDELRIGEALLLGRETTMGHEVPGGHSDACVFEAEVLEVADKSARGSSQRRAVVALGLADIGGGTVTPEGAGRQVALVASDHLVMTDEKRRLRQGDTVRFLPSYFALLGGMISSGVEKAYIKG